MKLENAMLIRLNKHKYDKQFTNAPTPYYGYVAVCEFLRQHNGPYQVEDKAYFKYWENIFQKSDKQLSKMFGKLSESIQ